ncbi:penicillin-binding transpeptidase domain-containing protein [uncultured Megasphaera sp.]|uniref:penicillin-binding transpeptidase domain-containing protein n=1 Tax=uncultured Megasphaera sp. TaxID=165188 RepID=UPI00262C590A|nr:penicillin-binding transpeptidase domain-containing protein [uncultured Megasphaera sp.]
MTEDKDIKQYKKIRKRIGTCVLVLFVFCAFISMRLVYLQVVQRGELTKMADSQAETDRKLQSPRGTIFDRNGKVLAISEMAKSLYADPTMLNKPPADIARMLAPYLRMPEADIQKALEEDTAFVWLERTMDHEKYEGAAQVIKEQKLEGLRFIDENHRFYPNNGLAAQVIGFVGENDEGLDGIEMILDEEIRGNVQTFRLMTDKNNIPIFDSALEKILPDKERSVRLTLDSTIQFLAEKSLDGIMERSRPEGAAVIVMDPKTGEILAMASRPGYNLNEFGKGSAEQYRNRAVVNLYEPGSTFKPIMAAAAIDSGKWDVNRVYHDVGYIQVADRTIQNWDEEGLGDVTVKDILKFSINTGMVKMGLTTGGQTMIDYAKRFGFGKATGIELAGEGSGILFDADDMSEVDEATMAIGQSIAVTPLQMVQAFGAIANGGRMMKPFIIKEIDNPDGSVYQKTEPQEIGRPIKEETASLISKILAEEISSGGGQTAKIDGYEFCGKTGTAQRLDPVHGGYAEGQYIGSFVGFGPLEDPQYVVLIVVDNPKGAYYGAEVAAPVFKEMMTDIVRIKGIRPSQPVAWMIEAGKKPREPKKTRDIPPIHRTDEGVLLPSFIGWDSREVNDWLNEAGLGFVPNGTGQAVYQVPQGGSYVPPGNNVTVTFMR